MQVRHKRRQFDSLGQEDPLEKGMAIHSSFLTWEIPWTEEPGGLQSMGSQRAGHTWVTERTEDLALRWPALLEETMAGGAGLASWDSRSWKQARSGSLEWARGVIKTKPVQLCWGLGLLSLQLVPLETQFSSVAPSCLTLCDPMDPSTPGFPVHYQLLEFTQTHVLRISDAIQPSHPLSSPSPPGFNLSQHQGLFQWAGSLHQGAKVLEFQLQHQFFQWIFTTDLF